MTREGLRKFYTYALNFIVQEEQTSLKEVRRFLTSFKLSEEDINEILDNLCECSFFTFSNDTFYKIS